MQEERPLPVHCPDTPQNAGYSLPSDFYCTRVRSQREVDPPTPPTLRPRRTHPKTNDTCSRDPSNISRPFASAQTAFGGLNFLRQVEFFMGPHSMFQIISHYKVEPKPNSCHAMKLQGNTKISGSIHAHASEFPFYSRLYAHGCSMIIQKRCMNFKSNYYHIPTGVLKREKGLSCCSSGRTTPSREHKLAAH